MHVTSASIIVGLGDLLGSSVQFSSVGDRSSLTTPSTEGCPGANNKVSPPGRHQEQAPKQRCTFRPTTFSSGQLAYHTIPWVCYRRRNQWLHLALALFCPYHCPLKGKDAAVLPPHLSHACRRGTGLQWCSRKCAPSRDQRVCYSSSFPCSFGDAIAVTNITA